MKAKIILAALPFAAAAFLGGCGTGGAFQSSAEYQRQGYADEVRANVDRQLRAEVHHEPPVGSMTQTYSSAAWAQYWNKRIAEFRTDFPKSKDYRGPTGEQFASYHITTRRDLGLPELP
jgi:hypothetical protein